MRKVHYLRKGKFGLFEHLMTYCGVAGDYVRDCWIRSWFSSGRYDYTNDWDKVTCKSCLNNKD